MTQRVPRGSKISHRLLALSASVVLAFLLANSDSDAEITSRKVSLNKTFNIALKANPSTGYKWEVSYDKNFVQLKEESHKRDPSKPKNYVGVGGITTFVFKPVKVGETEIEFTYKRPWEKEVADRKTFRIIISP